MAQRSAPLAGRPPYATDDDDSVFENSPAPTKRVRQPVDNPNDRTSAYNTYDNYLGDRTSRGDASAGIGGALLAFDSDSDDETDLHSVPPTRNAEANGRAGLYAAASSMNNPPMLSPTSPTRSPQSPAPPYSPPASGRMPTDTKPTPSAGAPLSAGASSSRTPSPTGQSALVSPRPVYAPNSPSRQAAFDVHSTANRPQPELTVQIPAPPSANLRADFNSRGPAMPTPVFMAPPANGGAGTPSTAGFGPVPGTPNEGLHPHPLQAPNTPITPVFAAPPRTVNFDEKNFNTPILRGNKEETLLARRGEKGDDFWRRFSMVAKQENAKPTAQKTSFFVCSRFNPAPRVPPSSPWLRNTQSGRSRMSRCVWVVAVILLLAIAGGIGVGWYFTHNNPGHTRPTAFGGYENEGMNGPGSSSISASASATSTHTGGLVKATHASTTRASTAAATPTAALDKRSEVGKTERLVARAFGQDLSASEHDALPVVVKKVRSHQKAKRRAWDRLI
ncbi:hypothetical protein FRC07_006653 [Ceratobasidium sp. 392]|nr:hypothetical protein FRC07_006653 [Ceratobasidium sp. 392]